MLSPYQLWKTLEKLRTNKHMSQVEVSEHINISPKTLSKWEHGDCYPDLKSLDNLSKLFEVSLLDMLYKDPDQYLKKFNPNVMVIHIIISVLLVILVLIFKYIVFLNTKFYSAYLEDIIFSLFIFVFIMFTDINYGIFKNKSIKIITKILLIILDIFYLFF